MIFSNVKDLSDSHFHILEMKKKNLDLELFFRQWENENGNYLIDVGVDENNLDERLSYSKNRNYLFHAVGIHPNYCTESSKSRIITLEKQISCKKIVAVGETGLDYYWDRVDKNLQKDFFIEHIKLAIKYDLPIIVHNRDACEDVFNTLAEFQGQVKGIIHCFSSTPSYVNKFLDLGFYLSFAGNISYKKSSVILESLIETPVDKLLIETDSPYLPPQKVRGKTNHPGHIGYTLDFICENKGISRDDLSVQLENNFLNIFRIRKNI